MKARIENHTGRKLALNWKEEASPLNTRGTAVSEGWSGENVWELNIHPPAAKGAELLIVIEESNR